MYSLCDTLASRVCSYVADPASFPDSFRAAEVHSFGIPRRLDMAPLSANKLQFPTTGVQTAVL